eukprot:CAMPEP_0197823484 /NCGR_PEP_ID=MMETSP1437-20131217/839_1 /TAXON_ID=49252 ORGANISM="Eucampia antarctica, Strain CCMP1452" /NCGR_SAMPLE_ID=MMETSP1437 /ASSEMBLY_ACC=CAM_ASM_001096 /LENGTH=150 /DNA_ID=CAMNT_0043422689 /DNA_START=36 /DNA_END=488 /DNA_ORIENTATION=+
MLKCFVNRMSIIRIFAIWAIAFHAVQQNVMVLATTANEQCDNTKDRSACEDPKCPSRPHIIRCAAAYLDTDGNNKLERSELEYAINLLPWYSRGILKVIGSVDKIMAKCDADGDDAIGIDTDMPMTEETCLASCFKRKAFKSAFFPECVL